MNVQRPPLSQIIIYALGQFGWSVAGYGAANLLVYFYLPPETSESAIFPAFIYAGPVLGIATLIGIINFFGRIFDGITDPWIASISDRMQSKIGKRRFLMAVSVLPFAILSFLVFYPPVAGVSNINAVWLVVIIFLFYLAMTVYLVPFYALMSELGHHPDDRMKISTISSITWSLGFILGSMAYSFQNMFEKSMSSTAAFQLVMGIFAVVSFVFMLIPVLFLKEKRYCYQTPIDLTVFGSLKSVFSNRNFRYFTASDLLYWLALSFIQQGISYYATVLFGFDKTYATFFLTISFLLSFVMYYPVNLITRWYGKKFTILASYLVFIALFACLAAVDYIPLPPKVLYFGLAALTSFPLATFGIVPMAIIADIVYEHEEKTGQAQSGMFYAARNFTMKMGISLANLFFPSLLLLGKSVDDKTGIFASVLAALGFCGLGFMVFRAFLEDKPKRPVKLRQQ